MIPGDLVKYGRWWRGPIVIGLILEQAGIYDQFFFVSWNDGRYEWEDLEELEVISENN